MGSYPKPDCDVFNFFQREGGMAKKAENGWMSFVLQWISKCPGLVRMSRQQMSIGKCAVSKCQIGACLDTLFWWDFFCQKVTVKTHNFLTKKDLFDSFLTIEEFPLKVHFWDCQNSKHFSPKIRVWGQTWAVRISNHPSKNPWKKIGFATKNIEILTEMLKKSYILYYEDAMCVLKSKVLHLSQFLVDPDEIWY